MKALRRRLQRIETALSGRRITSFVVTVDELEARTVRRAIDRHARKTGHRGAVIVTPPMAESMEEWLQTVKGWRADLASAESRAVKCTSGSWYGVMCLESCGSANEVVRMLSCVPAVRMTW